MSTDTPVPSDETPDSAESTPEAAAPVNEPAVEEAPAPVSPAAPAVAAESPTSGADAPPEPVVEPVGVAAAEGDAEASVADQLDIGSAAVEGVQPDFKPVIRGKVDRFGVAMGTGRRKTSVARVRIKDGSGLFTINGREVSEYLPMLRDQKMVEAPLRVTETVGKVDVWVKVSGGGTTGQTGAIVLGVARALQVRQPEVHHLLSEAGLLTRDSRMVERKKYGLRKARRSFQFSKR